MDENVHDRLAAELAAQPEPPLGDLVADALRQGKRIRRTRIAGSALAVVAVLVAGLLLRGHGTGPHHTPSASGSLTEEPTSPTTAAAVAYHLKQLVPRGNFSHYTVMGGAQDLQFYLDRGQGPGMVRITIGPILRFDCSTSTADQGMTTACGSTSGGLHMRVISNAGNCIQTTSVSVDHGNGIEVTVDVASCLPWNGTSNPPCPMALSNGEALAIAADPAWGPRMDTSLVKLANAEYPTLAVS